MKNQKLPKSHSKSPTKIFIAFLGFSVLTATLVTALHLRANEPDSIEAFFEKGIQNSPYPLREADESEIMILEKRTDALAARLRSIREAKKSIRIQTLIFAGDETGRFVANILKRKAQQGVSVKLIVDAVSGANPEALRVFADLKAHGIEVEGFEWIEWIKKNPAFINQRFHEKYWIVDGENEGGIAITGGMNLSNDYFGWPSTYEAAPRRDQDIALRGALVKDMMDMFDENYRFFRKIKRDSNINTGAFWKNAKNIEFSDVQKKKAKTIFAKIRQYAIRKFPWIFSPAKAQFLYSSPRKEVNYILPAYLELINRAREEIYIENSYFIPTDAFREAIKKAAERGVKVVIVTNSAKSTNFKFSMSIQRSYYKELLKANSDKVRIYEWQGNLSYQLLHSKYAIFDRKAVIVGSYNIDPRSENLNTENVIVFYNEALAEKLRQLTVQDIKLSKPVTMEEAEAYEKAKGTFKIFDLDYNDFVNEFL